MPSKKRLLFALPVVLFPAFSVLVLPSCQRSTPPPADRPATARQAVSGPACSPGSCAPLDEFDPLPGAGWMTLSTGCGDTGACDITVPLQEAVNTIAGNSVASESTVLPTVLYIPARTDPYTITSTIMVQGIYGGAIVGDDPSTTVITWGGAAPGTGGTSGSPMFRFVDSFGTKFARITLDGGLTSAPESDGGSPPWLAGVQVVQSQEGSAPPLPDDGGTANYLSVYDLDFDDDVFENLTLGIASYTFAVNVEDTGGSSFFQGGWAYDLSPGFAVIDSNVGSIDVRRSSFENILAQGVAVSGQNTLDWLIEDNAFINCHRGVTIEYNASANLVNNLFFNNDGDDVLNIYSNAAMSDVYRGNVSVGANVFYFGMSGDNVDLSGNYVLLNPEPTDGGAGNQHCYAIAADGKTLLLDNYISGPTSGVSCSLEQTGAGCTHAGTYHALGIYGTIAHGHNAYSGTEAGFIINPGQTGYDTEEMCVGGDAGCPGTGQSADSFGVAPGGAVPAAAQAAYVGWGSPTLGMATASVQRPTIAPKVTRSVLAAPSACASSPGTGCAAAVNALLAGATGGGQYLLYFPRGYYYVDGQIEIPASLDVVVSGDGVGTSFFWKGTALDRYVFHANAPSKAMFRDFQIDANVGGSRPGGILVDSHDDTGGLVYVDLGVFANVKSGIEVAGLDNVLVRAEQWGAGGERVADVIGGGAGSAGSGNTHGLFTIAGGSTPGSDYVTTRSWGKAVILGSDNEGDPQGTVLSQSGYVTLESGRFIAGPPNAFPGFYPAQPNVVAESTFRGNVTFANMQTTGGVLSAGAHQAQVLAFGNSYGALPGLPNAPVAEPCGTLAGPGCFPLTPPNAVPNAFAVQASGGATQMSLENWGSCTYEGVAITQLYADITNGSAAKSTFADALLADLRNAPYAAPICASSCGDTRVRIHDVWMTGGDQSVYALAMPPSTFMRSGLRVQRSN